MSDLLAQAAAKVGLPPSLAKRSAEARAKAEGVSPDVILARWAGVETPGGTAIPVAETPASAAAPAPAAETPAIPASEAPAPAPSAVAPAPVLQVQELGPEPSLEKPEPPVAAPEPAPGAETEPEEQLVGAAGIRQLARIGFPRWLAACFLAAPVIALWYAGAFATGASCGNSGALATDPVTGLAESCDGSDFGSGGDPLKVGARLYATASNPACAACHGDSGGGGAGPALAGGSVVETFPACEDHIRWVTLGSNGWRQQVGPVYGASEKPVGGAGIMQGFGAGLSEDQIRAVVLYERVQFGGLDPAVAAADCLPPVASG